MEKNLKKSYQYLDLPYSATIEEVEARKKALIKILTSKDIENKINKEKEIALVNNSANVIIKNIKQNGVPNEIHCFESSNESIWGLFVILMFFVSMCFFSFYAFL